MRHKKELTRSADRLAGLIETLPPHDAIEDTLDYLAGALYCLIGTASLRFWERRGRRLNSYKTNLASYVRAMPNGQEPGEYWRSGTSFHSAMQRLAACFDRIPKLILKRERVSRRELGLSGKGDASPLDAMFAINRSRFMEWQKVYEEVNSLKHDTKGLALKREASELDAVHALEQALDLLESRRSNLETAYT